MQTGKICCIGHITLDKIVTPKHTAYLPGGTSFYFSYGMKHLCNAENYELITSLAPSEYKSVEDMRAQGIQVKVIPSQKTVYFENIYGENSNDRTQNVLAKADPFKTEDLINVDANVYHLGSLLADDFPFEVIKYLSTKGRLSVDAQGYLREVRGTKVVPVDWSDKMEAFKYIDVLKVNEIEAHVLTGLDNWEEAAKKLGEWGVKEVLLTLGSYGSMVYAGGKLYKIPAYPPKKLVDATGCGDTYVLGYLYQRNKGADFETAAKFAAAMSTIKLTGSGPFSGTEQDIWDVVHENEQKA